MIIKSLQDKLSRHQTYLDQDPSNRTLRLTTGLLKAQILHHQQHISEAITLLEQLHFENESSAEVTGLLALLHFDNHDAVKAERFANLNPTQNEAQLVNTLLKAVKQEATLEEINTQLEINPQDSRLWFALGATHMHNLDIPAAEQAFSQATAIYPEFYDAWICFGWCHVLQNNMDKAFLAYQQAISINANAANGWSGQALISALRCNTPEAAKALQTVSELDPDCYIAKVTRVILTNQNKKASK